jgi:hypothetical protein
VGTNVSDRQGLQYGNENRERFGALDVLYAWIPCVDDHQWIYNNDPPHEVFSVDHTRFFPLAFDWTEAGLAAEAANVALEPQLATLGLGQADRAAAITKIQQLATIDIAGVVAQPPPDWGVGLSERRAVASYLWTRIDPVAALCSA